MTKRRSVKPVSDPNIFNMHHPSIRDKVEFAFESNGEKYYTFKSDADMRYGRYVILQTFLQEYNLRTSLDTLKNDVRALKRFLNPTISKDGKGQLEIGKACELLEIMEQRCDIAFEPETVYRLASCLYFTEHEILTEYDRKANEEKIARWKEANTVDFFFSKLFIELTNLRVTSRDALVSYLQSVPELLKGWKKASDILKR